MYPPYLVTNNGKPFSISVIPPEKSLDRVPEIHSKKQKNEKEKNKFKGVNCLRMCLDWKEIDKKENNVNCFVEFDHLWKHSIIEVFFFLNFTSFILNFPSPLY